MTEKPEMICVGAISGAFGVKGEVRIKSFCADPAAIGNYNPLSTESGTVYDLGITRAIKGGFAAVISGVDNKEDADALRSTRLYTARENLPSLPDDEFYHTDLVGLTAVDTGGETLGKVKTVLNHGAGDILEITGPGLKEPVLLPFTKGAVPTVDLAANRIVIDPPEGLFPQSDS
ncbi:MAG: 16S rRNA processing protein RimM [Rhodobacteraceae bacterium]|nr:MAG: 16S rRNA processing protein RimM [Paracoccaceae bacterium]